MQQGYYKLVYLFKTDYLAGYIATRVKYNSINNTINVNKCYIDNIVKTMITKSKTKSILLTDAAAETIMNQMLKYPQEWLQVQNQVHDYFHIADAHCYPLLGSVSPPLLTLGTQGEIIVTMN